ncbi:hypothetical protein PhCBS80983_g01578 [Powellomyces hirtus]|uniref:RRM domain-containing protein n=1 Tax=Powellomyces hirtus TaxID=109895 RepID=A0A507EAD3_9FUNG|nr:hypothetical protein PhCBS80983_g01578 [Powellomyces hirtus]
MANVEEERTEPGPANSEGSGNILPEDELKKASEKRKRDTTLEVADNLSASPVHEDKRTRACDSDTGSAAPPEVANSTERKNRWLIDTAPTATTAAATNSIPSPLSAGLTPDQRLRLDKAKAFARETTTKLLGSKAKLSAFIAPNGLLSLAGVEARSIAVMSRIYVGSINFELTEVHIKAVFTQFGFVRSVSMTMDPMTGKHKGFCFVEYEVPEAAELALEIMNGADLGGRPLKVGRPNNYNHGIGANLPPPIPSRIYIANVNEFVSEENVESIFEAFGMIKACSLLPDLLLRKHKGNGYIEFEDEASADSAIASMNNFELGGLPLRVRKALVGGPMPPGMKNIDELPAVPAAPAVPARVLNVAQNINSTIAQRTAIPTAAVGSAISTNSALQHALAKVHARVNEENMALEENMSISANQRFAIMQKLMRADAEATFTSNVICLRNMVAVKDVDDSLNEEISEESSKYGHVTKVLIWLDPAPGAGGALDPFDSVDIYVQFDHAESAAKARQALDKRWFAGRQISAAFARPEELAEKEARTQTRS